MSNLHNLILMIIRFVFFVFLLQLSLSSLASNHKLDKVLEGYLDKADYLAAESYLKARVNHPDFIRQPQEDQLYLLN